MATYQDGKHVVKITNAAFDKEYKPGEAPPHSGIYKCSGCGHEVVAEEARSFPSQNHRQHNTLQGLIRWKLLVYADHEAKL